MDTIISSGALFISTKYEVEIDMKSRTSKARSERLVSKIAFTDNRIPASVIPPLSEVKLVKVPGTGGYTHGDLGKIYRIGYYRRKDGLDCVWLVDDEGLYFGTVNQRLTRTHFEVLSLSDESDLFGLDREVIRSRTESA